MRTIDNKILYPRALEIHRAFGIPEEQKLGVAALMKSSHFKELREEYKKYGSEHTRSMNVVCSSFRKLSQSLQESGATPEVIAHMEKKFADELNNFRNQFPYAGTTEEKVVESELKKLERYVYKEEKESLKTMMGKLGENPIAGPIIGVLSVGQCDEKRLNILKDLGIKRENWQRGEDKFSSMQRLITDVYNRDKKIVERLITHSNFTPTEDNTLYLRKHNIRVLIDNNEDGIDKFIERGKELLAQDPDADGEQIIVGVYYKKTDDETTIEALQKEFEIAASTSSSTVGLAWKMLGY